MKILLPLFLALLVSSPSFARVAPPWQDYTQPEYGVAFAYPANWSAYANVNTEFKSAGLQSVFSVCLTPGPVKTLSCQAIVDVIPEAKFTPPSGGKFLGLAAQPNVLPKDSPWSGSFVVNHGSSPSDAMTSYYAAHNGYEFIVTVQGGPDSMARLLASFQFTTPKSKK